MNAIRKKVAVFTMVFGLLGAVAMPAATSTASAEAGWYAAKKLGGGAGWQVFAGGAGGAAGGYGGAKAGALIGSAGGPVGLVIGTGLGAL